MDCYSYEFINGCDEIVYYLFYFLNAYDGPSPVPHSVEDSEKNIKFLLLTN